MNFNSGALPTGPSALFHTFASGLIYSKDPESGDWLPGGSCAAIGDRSHWVTAAHCVQDGRQIALLRGGLFNHQLRVTDVQKHPDADLAMLRVDLGGDDAPAGLERHFYLEPLNTLALGSDFIGSAYPMSDGAPVERVLKGYLQR